MPADTITHQLRGSFYRGNRLAFVLAAAGALIGAVLNLIISWLMQQLIDTAAGTPGALPFRILVRACGGVFLLIPRNRGKSCSHASPRSTTISTLPFSYSTNFLSQEPSNTNGKIHAIAIFLIVFGFHFVTYW